MNISEAIKHLNEKKKDFESIREKAEYIEKAELIKKLCLETAVGYCSPTIKTIKEFPVADVHPMKCGHWYHNTSKYISELDAYFIQACCSCCGKYSDRVDSYSQLMSNAYCSHCGARMKQEE